MSENKNAYGIFATQRNPVRYAIYTGKVTDNSRGMVTVDYGVFSYTHLEHDEGRQFFYNLDAAQQRLEDLRVYERFGG